MDTRVGMDLIISFCKERGFVYQGSEIYDGIAGVYDFGPRGVELLNNIKKSWWREMVMRKSDVYGLDSGIFKNPRTWEASGHITSFSDPMTECLNCKTRIRADKELAALGINADEKMSIEELQKLFDQNLSKIKCPKCDNQAFSPVRKFNLLVHSNFGNFTDTGDPVYLPGEACQGIYLNFKNIVDSLHPKIPFGIAQIGKAFRNEISPRNFLFRTREIEQADLQYFIRPGENTEHYKRIREERMAWYRAIGLHDENLRWSQHENLVFYASDAWDIEYNFPDYGFDEIEGVHDRTDYDLSQHSKFSGLDLSYNDDGDRFTPYIVETSMGLGRVFLAVICDAYDVEELPGNDSRIVLRLHHDLAPYKCAILPLMNKDGLPEKGKEVFDSLAGQIACTFDTSGSIGKRYRRQDEIGTPFCITVDYDSLENGTVTVRERDSMQQETVSIDDLRTYLSEKLEMC